MLRRNPIVFFSCRLAIIFALLAAPWPGLGQAYGRYFRAIGRMVFAADDGQRQLSFETPGENSPRPNDTRIVIVNKALMQSDGSGPVRNMDVKFGRESIAFLLALILATPVSWSRRAWAALWGLLAMHCFIFTFLAFCIWNESTEILLVNVDPFWRTVASGGKEALASQFNLAVPVLIWLLVTFRREDRFGGLGQFVFRQEGEGNEVGARS